MALECSGDWGQDGNGFLFCTGVISETPTPEPLTAADFDVLWGGILLVFVIAFAFKMIRRLMGF